MRAQSFDLLPVTRLSELVREEPVSGHIHVAELPGRLLEFSSSHHSANLMPVCALILEAQRSQEPVVWIAQAKTIFFPPDMAANGIDLEALPVVWVPHVKAAVRTADHLIRSGAFGLVILDLDTKSCLDQGMLGRLIRLSDRHGTSIVCITSRTMRSMRSLGSMVSIRGETRIRTLASNLFRCEVYITKDKRRGPGWKYEEVCCGPDGLC